MKAAICYEFGKPLVIEDVTIDEPGKDEVKVKIAVTAICHSDLHCIKGELPFPVPGLAGHEISGYIDKVGEGVTEFKKGDHVIVGTVTAGCGHCYYCTVGLQHMCTSGVARPHPGRCTNKKGQKLATYAGPSGGFAEYTVIHKSLAVKIPEDFPMDKAALLACGVTTGFGAVMNRAQVKPMSSVAVIGTGGVGLNAIQAAVISGAYPVIAVDILDSKLEFAKKFGATHTLNTTKEKDPVAALQAMTEGRGADYVFVTVGAMAALRQGFSMSAPRGMTVVLGLMGGTLKDFSPFEFIMGEKVLTGCGGGSIKMSIDIPYLVNMYQAGRLKLDELITARYPLSKINEAIESLEKGQALRNLIIFDK
jgi:Zn-dependent alcohol dehydrogenase